MKAKATKSLPKIVSSTEWEKAHEKLLMKEKAATKERDRLAAERRRLPMTEISGDYVFNGPKGKVSLLELFAGADNSSSTTSCSLPVWTVGPMRPVRAAHCFSIRSAVLNTCRPETPRSPSSHEPH